MIHSSNIFLFSKKYDTKAVFLLVHPKKKNYTIYWDNTLYHSCSYKMCAVWGSYFFITIMYFLSDRYFNMKLFWGINVIINMVSFSLRRRRRKFHIIIGVCPNYMTCREHHRTRAEPSWQKQSVDRGIAFSFTFLQFSGILSPKLSCLSEFSPPTSWRTLILAE